MQINLLAEIFHVFQSEMAVMNSPDHTLGEKEIKNITCADPLQRMKIAACVHVPSITWDLSIDGDAMYSCGEGRFPLCQR